MPGNFNETYQGKTRSATVSPVRRQMGNKIIVVFKINYNTKEGAKAGYKDLRIMTH